MPAVNPISSIKAGLLCRCPRCGEGKLFGAYLKIRDDCPKCGLDYSFADPADGPAFFVGTGVGLVVMGGWAWWAVTWQPTLWLQFVVAPLALLGGCLGVLQPVKAWLVAEEYINKAGEGEIAQAGHGGRRVSQSQPVAPVPSEEPGSRPDAAPQ